MGLALTEELLSQASPQWRVIMADIQPPPETFTNDSDRWRFVRCDVTSWEDNLATFKTACSWDEQHRIDFFAANAGLADREFVYGPWGDLDEDPEKPNLLCVDVDLISVFYGLKLFIHFSRKTQRDLGGKEAAQGQGFNPKMVITASCAGQYHFPIAPQYAAAKHALVGLTRSVGAKLMNDDNIAVNAVMPAFIPTPLISQTLKDAWPKEYVTPVATVTKGFMELIDDEGRVREGSDGKDGEVKAGCTVECINNKLYYRKGVESADESQQWLRDQAEAGGMWWTVYERGGGITESMKEQDADRKRKLDGAGVTDGTAKRVK